MAMTEEQAIELLAAAAGLAANLASLIPQIVTNIQSIKAGLATNDETAINAAIVSAHAGVQALDAQLQAIRTT